MTARANRGIAFGGLLACLVLVLAGSPASAAPAMENKPSDAGYDVTLKQPAIDAGTQPTFQAENPANNLRLVFSGTGMLAIPVDSPPDSDRQEPWSLDLRPLSIAFEGEQTLLGPAKLSASEDGVTYDFGTATVRYVNTEGGLEQVFTVPAPAAMAGGAAPASLTIDLAVGDALTPQIGAYFVDLVAPNGAKVLRYGAIRATDANGTTLDSDIQVTPASEGTPAGVRIVVRLNDSASPIEVHAVIRQPGELVAAKGTLSPTPAPTPGLQDQIEGDSTPMSAPITETVDEIMARDKFAPQGLPTVPRETHPEMEPELNRKDNPLAPPVSRWPLSDEPAVAPGSPSLNNPQTLGTSFKGVNLAESGFIPPDSMGDVGPTQILFHENGRIKVFNKVGTLGSLNVTDLAFWTSVDGASQPSDPEVRYDRLTGRWFLMAMNTVNPNNKVMIAYTAPNATITSAASFTFTSFQGPNAADGTVCLMDYPSFGIDNNAIYIGSNMFCGATSATESYVHSNVWVIPKAGLLAGSPVVTAFRNVTNGVSGPGPYSPMGVDNDDPQSTEGYFIGDDLALFSQLDIIKVSTPGGTPTIGSTIALTVPTTTNPILQPALGSTTNLDASDTRLIKAAIHKNKITGASTLWTAHHIEVNTACVGTVGGGRNGARWYELAGTVPTTTQPLGGSIYLKQAGTLCDPTGSGPKGYIYPSVVETGQGHMTLGATVASTSIRASVAVAGRLRSDTLGATQAATQVVTGLAAYTNVSNGRNRWGDYSFTDVDPLDDQTVWTFQEYCDATNSWAVQAIQLKAPVPATPASASLNVCLGRASTKVVVTGTSSAGTEFFDPGADPGGPGYANHIGASLANGTAPTVNSVTFTDPTHVTLDLNSTSATAGAKNVTITNPDGQTATGTNLINVVATCSASISGTVTDSGTGLGINGATVAAQNLTTTTSSTGAYSFPSLPAGNYAMTVTAPGYSLGAAGVTVVDGQNATQNFTLTPGVSDSAACTTDTIEPDFEAGTLSGVDTASSPGNVVLPLTTQIDQSNTTLALVALNVTTAQFYAQSFVAGVTGNMTQATFYGGTTSTTGSPTITVEVHNDNGAGLPGTLIAGATANTGTFPAANTVFTITVTLGTAAPVTAGTRYHLVFKGTIATARAFVSPSCSPGPCDPYPSGVASLSTNTGTSYTAQNFDLPFSTYVIATATTGTVISTTKDANPSSGNTARWNLSWTGTAPANTSLQFQAAGSNNPAGPFTFVGPGGSTGAFFTTSPVSVADMAQFNGFRYVRYKAFLGRTALVTPTLNDVTVCFSDGCQGATNGTACNDGNACTQTDTCQNNVCVGSNPVVCSAGDQCSFAATCNVSTGVCSATTPKSAATLCTGTSQGGACDNDAADHCSGTSNACVDAFQSSSFTCRNSAGQCDVAETCTGSSGTCPVDGFASSSTLCTGTSQGGACDNDAADHCTGTSNSCVDVYQAAGFTCRAATGACDVAETCDGSVGTCPTDGFQSAGTACGDPSSGSCDNADTCDGLGACQSNHVADGTNCGDAGTACTNQDTCLAGVCHDNGFQPAGTACGDPSSGSCDAADTCDGSGACQSNHVADGTSCGDAGTACTNQDTCLAGVCHDNGFQPAGTACGDPSSGSCDNADSCDGAGGCQSNHVADGTSCGDAGTACTNQDTCLAGACHDNGFQPAGTACGDPSSGSCDTADSCDGAGACQSNHVADGTNCGDAGTTCTNQDTCLAGVCNDNGFQPAGTACGDPSSGSCDAADSCDGSGVCQSNHVADGTNCGDAGTACTNQDTCLAGVCNDNGFQPAGTACGDPSSGSCDAADTCDGSGACQSNHVADGTNCGDAGSACVNQDSCLAGVCHDNGFQPAGTACGDPTSGACDAADTCNGSGSCQSNHVADGTNCGDAGSACVNQDSCLAGVCHDNGFQPAGTACGDPSSGACDAADTCNGSGSCQSNHVADGTNCGDAGTACTNQDTCLAGVCHDNGFQPAGTACGDPSSGACDAADTCNGSGSCQSNHVADGTNCGDAGTACTNQDTCLAGVCHDNGFQPAGTACGDPSSGSCDAADTCNGSGSCQSNHAADGTNCGDAGSACVNQDTCLAGVCHDNGFQPAGTACGNPSSGACDAADSCDGSGSCQSNQAPDGTNCGDAGTACTNQDTCLAGVCHDNGFQPAGTACGDPSSGSCDAADSCNGSGVCQSNHVADGTNCGDAGSACVNQDTCLAGVCHDNGFQPAGTACGDPSSGSCDAADTCNGSGACQSNHAADGTNCGDAGSACVNQDTCLAGVCHDNGFQPAGTACGDPSSSACDAADSCNGSGACQSNHLGDGTNCGDAGSACTNQDTCLAGLCHDNGFKPAGTACGDPSSGACDSADSCNGAGSCQSNHAADGTHCGDAGSACVNQDTCLNGACHDNGVQPNGAPCSDGNACTAGETCQSGACGGGTAVVCNDNNSCTDDACNPATGCVFVADDANSCTDGNICTADACHAGSCDHTASGLCGVSGTVYYDRTDSGAGSEPSSKPVPNVGIDWTSDSTADATTGAPGTYSFNDRTGNVTVTTLPKYGNPRASDFNGSISALDASAVARAAVGTLTLSPNQRLAGDVTGDNTISSFDASYIARFATQLVDHFPVATNSGSDWKFLRCDTYHFPGTPGCGSPNYRFTPLAGPHPDSNFYAILYGEVTGNWQPGSAFSSAASASPEDFTAAAADRALAARIQTGEVAAQIERSPSSPAAGISIGGWTAPLAAGQRRTLTINLSNADGILALDLVLKLDPTRLAIVSVGTTGIGTGYNAIYGATSGTNKVAMYGVAPLAGSGAVLNVTVEALAGLGSTMPVSVSGTANEGRIPVEPVAGPRGKPIQLQQPE